MHITELILLSLSLAADAFAVAIGAGISQKKILLRQALLMALCFGIFQAIMPITGYTGASLFADIIRDYDHWIAFILLGYLGGNMVYEGFKGGDDVSNIKNIFSFPSLMTLGVATSIDALAVGVSLTATKGSILISALSIGVITFILSFIGVEFGKRFGIHIGKKAEIFGGITLVTIGIKILVEHTLF